MTGVIVIIRNRFFAIAQNDKHNLLVEPAPDAATIPACFFRHSKTLTLLKTPIMDNTRVYRMSFASVYPLYINKVERKGRTKAELDEIIAWLTGYDGEALQRIIDHKTDFETFFAEAPALNPNVSKITGLICGYRVEDIEDPVMQKVRYLDKLVDELAKGRPMEKILRK